MSNETGKYSLAASEREAAVLSSMNSEQTAEGYRKAEEDLTRVSTAESKERELRPGPSLIMLYGPPSAGKLSIGQELASLTGYDIYHNQEAVDLVGKDIPFGTGEFWDKVFELRLKEIEKRLADGKNVITTFCYNPKPRNDEYIQAVDVITKKFDGNLLLIKLICSEEELLRRVVGDSRKEHGKIVDQETLLRNLATHDYSTEIEHKNSVSIDNTELSPREVAMEIFADFELKPVDSKDIQAS